LPNAPPVATNNSFGSEQKLHQGHSTALYYWAMAALH